MSNLRAKRLTPILNQAALGTARLNEGARDGLLTRCKCLKMNIKRGEPFDMMHLRRPSQWTENFRPRIEPISERIVNKDTRCKKS